MFVAVLGATELNTAGDISAIIAAAVVLGSALWTGGGSLRRRFRLRRPLDVAYLIPQRKYKSKDLQGAPEAERYPRELTVALGTHAVMHRLVPRMDLEIVGCQLELIEGEGPTPQGRGPNNPMFIGEAVDFLGRKSVVDWHGRVELAEDIGPPCDLEQDEPFVIGNAIQAEAPYTGMTQLSVAFRLPNDGTPRRAKFPLKFVVSDEPDADEIPFLVV